MLQSYHFVTLKNLLIVRTMNVEKSARLNLFLSSLKNIYWEHIAQRILGPGESDNQKSHK